MAITLPDKNTGDTLDEAWHDALRADLIALDDGLTSVGGGTQQHVVWEADMETGDLSEWYAPETSETGSFGGGPQTDDGATAVASTTQKRSGSYSAALTVPGPPIGGDGAAGARLFRWDEPRRIREYWVDFWMYFPVLGVRTGDPGSIFWSFFQFKSTSDDNTRNDSLYLFEIINPTGSTMRVRLGWWGGIPVNGPHAGESGGRNYEHTGPDIPIGQWVNFRCWMRQNSAGNFDGALKFWQDDVLLYDLSDIRTGYDNDNFGNTWGTDQAWSINNYSNGINDAAYTLYVDDVRMYEEVPYRAVPSGWSPAVDGLLGTTFDPAIPVTGVALGNSTSYWSRIDIAKDGTISAVGIPVMTAGASLSMARLGIHDDAGVLIAYNSNMITAMQTQGLQWVTITPNPGYTLDVVRGQSLWVWIATTGTTRPTLPRCSNTNSALLELVNYLPSGYDNERRRGLEAGGTTDPQKFMEWASPSSAAPFLLAVR